MVRFDREPVAGVANPAGFVSEGKVELLSVTGTLVQAELAEVKAICFVKDLPSGADAWIPNRLFNVRPKTEGLWLRFRFRDADTLDGVVPNNLLAFDSAGFTVIPPDPSFFNQRIFVPRAAVLEAKVMGVIGSPLRQSAGAVAARKKARAAEPAQILMFEE